MKKSLSLLVGALVPAFSLVGGCGDDVYDAALGVEDVDASRRDATSLPPPPADAGGDVQADGATPDADVTDGDVPDGDVPDGDVPDGGGTLPATFVAALQAAYCANYNGCCVGDPNTPPAGDTCADNVATPGFFSGLLDAYYIHPTIATSDRVRVDETAMAACLANVAALGCINVEDQVTATAWRGVLEQCSAALYGIGVAGDSCRSDIECDKTTSCRGAVVDGGAGTCVTLSAAGEGAAFSGASFSDSCSYRGFGQQQSDPSVVPSHVDGTSVCQPLRATGENCSRVGDGFGGFDVNCESRACSWDDEVAPTGSYCSDFKNDLYRCVYALP